MSTLRVQNLSAHPWGETLLQHIDFSLEPGTVLALAGPNGAGKSTLLKIIAGDIQPNAGGLTLGTQPLSQWHPVARARHLAYLPQMSLLNFPYTVEEVILLGRTPHDSGRERDLEILDRVLTLCDLTDFRHKLYTQLSGGEKQRTQLGRVFAQIWSDGSLAGRLLLLDEPNSALDLAHQQQILAAIRLLAQRGCAVVLVIHDLNLAAAVADQVLVLHRGQQAALGPPGAVFTQELFRNVFQVEVTISKHPRDGIPMITPQPLDLA